MTQTDAHPIVLYDGVCNFCNGAVNFIIDRDPHAYFRFASLQSDIGQRLCAEHGIATDVSTIALIEDGRGFVRTNAALRIARHLSGAWPALCALVVIPRPLRDWAYSWFAARRYRWFGKSDTCRVPSPEVRARFLDS